MSLLFYDKGMFKKLKGVYKEVFYAAPEEIFKVSAKNHGGTKIILPMIGIWRIPDINISRDLYNDVSTRVGRNVSPAMHRNVEFPNRNVAKHDVPVSLMYQIDVYASKREVCDGLTAELIMEFMENPFVNVNIESLGDDYVQMFGLALDDSISDNTDIGDFESSNRIYRLTLTVNIDQAVLYRIDLDRVIEETEMSLSDAIGEDN